MENKDSSSGSSDFTLGFLAGSIFGGLLSYVWFTPQGQDKIKEVISQGEKIVETMGEKLGEETKEVIQEVKDSVSNSDQKGSVVKEPSENQPSKPSGKRFYKKSK